MSNIRKGKILYKGMTRGRTKFLIINILVTILYIMFMCRAMPFIVGKLHGPHDFNPDTFFDATEDMVIDKMIVMAPREDKSILSYTFMENSYHEGNKYRFNVSFDSIEKIHDGVIAEDVDETEESSVYKFNKIYMGKIEDRNIPILWSGIGNPDSTVMSGIFTEPAKVVVSRISETIPVGGQINMNEYVFDARGIEMETENTDIPFAIMGFILLAFLYIRLIRYYINPYTHPTYKRIEKYGDLEEVINKIEDQFEQEEIKQDGKEFYTTDWIVTKEFFSNKVKVNHRTPGRYS